jgi:hypothetical protein
MCANVYVIGSWKVLEFDHFIFYIVLSGESRRISAPWYSSQYHYCRTGRMTRSRGPAIGPTAVRVGGATKLALGRQGTFDVYPNNYLLIKQGSHPLIIVLVPSL